jgi:hypothetical protein
MNITLSTVPPQAKEATMIVVGWYYVNPRETPSQNVNVTLIKRDGVFHLGQENNKAIGRVFYTDKTETFFE